MFREILNYKTSVFHGLLLCICGWFLPVSHFDFPWRYQRSSSDHKHSNMDGDITFKLPKNDVERDAWINFVLKREKIWNLKRSSQKAVIYVQCIFMMVNQQKIICTNFFSTVNKNMSPTPAKWRKPRKRPTSTKIGKQNFKKGCAFQIVHQYQKKISYLR